MRTNLESEATSQRGRSWNKGKFIGQKPPLQPKHVWAIRTRLQLDKREERLSSLQPGDRQQVAGM